MAFTLLEPNPSIGWHYAEVGRRWGITADAEALDAAFFAAWKEAKREAAVLPQLPYGRNRGEAMCFWRHVIMACFREAGSPVEPSREEFFRAVFEHFEGAECWRLYADAEEAFALLDRARVAFGVLSNFDHRLHAILANMGISGRLGPIVLSADAGEEKPAPALFRHAEALLPGHQRAAIALIGDDEEDDGLGARDAGWRQCLVRRSGEPPQDPSLSWAASLPQAVAELLDT